MKNGAVAIFVSLVIHALIGAGIALCMECAPGVDALPQLDLTRIDLSFAETPDESAKPADAQVPKELAPLPPQPKVAMPVEPLPVEEVANPDAPEASELPKVEELPVVAMQAPSQAKIDVPARSLRSIRPDYPRESRMRGERGDVRMEVTIGAGGEVERVVVAGSSGYPLLDRAAVEAVRSAGFAPAVRDGRSVPSTVGLTLSFVLK